MLETALETMLEAVLETMNRPAARKPASGKRRPATGKKLLL
jgi:hypothetical protein